MKEKDKYYHIAFGLHSGIPVCCIVWWINATAKQKKDQYKKMEKAYTYKQDYLPCPSCTKQRKSVFTERCDYKDDMCWEFVDKDAIKTFKAMAKAFGIKRKFRTDREMCAYIDKYLGD